MGDIVTIEFDTRAADARPGRRFITLMTQGFLVLLIGIVLFDGAVLWLGLVPGEGLLSMGPDSAYLGAPPHRPGIVLFDSLPLPTRLAYAATLVLDTVPALMALLELRGLLRRFERGRFFEEGSRRRLSRAAAWLVAGAVAPAVGRALVVFAGHGVDQAWLHASVLLWLVGAAVLLAFGRVLREGRDIERDLGGIV